MTLIDRIRRAPLESLVDRLDGLRSFVAATEPYLPAERLVPARGVIERAGERLKLSRDHTVVALAGSTGSGKSSLFNALAGEQLSATGVRRPTTGAAHACVWGGSGADELLEWLEVPPAKRFRPSVADSMDGLVLLDLPDFDSVREAHRTEVDRLLALVDLVVWVLDPQKYADRVVHRQYLSRFRRHKDITVVLLHQADRLTLPDVERIRSDLGRLLTEDGLAGVPVLATSVIGTPGPEPLRKVLTDAVAARRASLTRLAADVDTVVADLAPLVGPSADDPDRDTGRTLTDALADAAGVPVVTTAVAKAYRHRALGVVGWPLTRWLRKARPDPLARLGLARSGPAATSLPSAAPAQEAAVGLALRAVADQAAGTLPPPWPDAVLTAARTHRDDLRDALDQAVAGTDLGVPRRPAWWRAVGVVQWAATFAALVGLLWLGLRYLLFVLALPALPSPEVGSVPLPTVLFLGGLLTGLLTSIVVRPLVRLGARRAGRRAAHRLREAVGRVGEALVLVPVREVTAAYREARAALPR